MTERYLESRGIAYRTNEFKDSRQTLVFIHGLSGSLSAWYPHEKLFEEKYNVVTLDLRGHGLSKRYKKYSDYALNNFSEDVYAVLTELKVNSCILVSHSLGALVALELLHHHPHVVSKAIFISPAAQNDKLFWYHASHPVRELGVIAGFVCSIFKKPHGRTNYDLYKDTADWSFKRTLTDVSNMGRLTYLYVLNNLYAFKHNEWWQEINIPVLFLHGSRDTMVPLSYARALAKEVPDAQFVVFENKNHLLPLNSVSEVSKAIEDFISR